MCRGGKYTIWPCFYIAIQTSLGPGHTVFSWTKDCSRAVKPSVASLQQKLTLTPSSPTASSRPKVPSAASSQIASSRATSCTAPDHTQCRDCQALGVLSAALPSQSAPHSIAQTLLKSTLIGSTKGLSVCLQLASRSCGDVGCQPQTRSVRTAAHDARNSSPIPSRTVYRNDLFQCSHVGNTVLRAPDALVPGATGLATVIALLQQHSYAA